MILILHSSIFFAAPVKWLPFQSIRPGSAGWLNCHGFPQFSMHPLFWLSPGYPFNKAGKSMFWTWNKHLILIAWQICIANICCGLLSEWFWVFLSDIFLCISEWFLSFLCMICQFHRQIFLILKRRSSSLMDHSLAFCLLISGNNCPIYSWCESGHVWSVAFDLKVDTTYLAKKNCWFCWSSTKNDKITTKLRCFLPSRLCCQPLVEHSWAWVKTESRLLWVAHPREVQHA